MTAQIISLADYREQIADTAPSEMPFAGIYEAADELFAAQLDLITLTLNTLSTAAAVATVPLWPGGGIDDLDVG